MKNLLKKSQSIIFALGWFVSGILFMVLMSNSNSSQQNRLCSGLNISIDHEKGNFFVDEMDVEGLIRSQLPGQNIETPLRNIHIKGLEEYLKANPYIQNAEIYVDVNGQMNVTVAQLYPVVRVVNVDNQSYYVNREGEKLPVSDYFSSRVPIASGYINDNGFVGGSVELPITQAIHELALFIDEDEFWKSQIEQIYVESNGDFILIPKVGDHEIILGDIEDLERKFKDLMTFYQEGLASVGWDKYKKINLKYKNQIVCTKK